MYKDILFSVDLNHDSSWNKALPVVIAHAKAFGSKVHIVTVLPDFGLPMVGSFFPKGFEAKAREKARQKLHEFVDQNVPSDISVQHVVAEGTVYEEILQTAEKLKADLIVMASHRPELKDYLLGPNAARVVRHANCSVLVVRD